MVRTRCAWCNRITHGQKFCPAKERNCKTNAFNAKSAAERKQINQWLLKHEQGFIYLTILVFLTCLSQLFSVMLTRGLTAIKANRLQITREQAFQAAEAGINDIKQRLQSGEYPWTACDYRRNDDLGEAHWDVWVSCQPGLVHVLTSTANIGQVIRKVEAVYRVQTPGSAAPPNGVLERIGWREVR